MNDQCGYCTVRGDLKECESQPCTTHDSWYVKQLTDRAEKAEALVKELKQENDRLENLRLKLRISLYHFIEHVEETLGDWRIQSSEVMDQEYLDQIDHFKNIMRREI